MRVLAYGEILWDVIEGVEHLGGAPFNFAAHSAQCGNEAFIISRLGSDYLGMRAFNQCKARKVDQTFIQWDETYPTGRVDVTLEKGQPDYVIQRNVAYDFIDLGKLVAKIQDQSFDVFYFGSLAQRKPVSANTLENILAQFKFRHIFYDVNLRKMGYTEAIVRNSLKACTILKLNSDEVPVIANMLVGDDLEQERFCQCVGGLFPNIRIIIITAAENGCYVFESNRLHHIPGVPVRVTDAVGAGDAFSAAFMHTYAISEHAIYSARVANHIGAFVATRSGAIPEYSKEIKEMLNGELQAFRNVQSIL